MVTWDGCSGCDCTCVGADAKSAVLSTFGTGAVAVSVCCGFTAAVNLIVLAAIGSRPGAAVGGAGSGLTFGTGDVAVCVNCGFIAAVNLIVLAAVPVELPCSADASAGAGAGTTGVGIGFIFGTGDVAVSVCCGFIAAVSLIV